MKKIAFILLIVTVCLCFSACNPSWRTLDEHLPEDVNEIVSIELINYDNPSQKQHFFLLHIFPSVDYLPFDHDRCTLLETLPDEKKEEFFKELDQVDTVINNWYVNSPKGIGLKITYASGNFLIVSDSNYSFIGEYAADGTYLEYRGGIVAGEDFTGLLNKYFEYRISA